MPRVSKAQFILLKEGGRRSNINCAVNMSFKFDSLYCFLTYTHCNANQQQLYDHLSTIKSIEWARICIESHEDGEPHLHCVAKFSSRFQSRNARVFDAYGVHPNIQSVRSVTKSLAYVAKDGQFVDFGPVPSASPKRTASEALELAGENDEAEYLRACLEAKVPFQYAKRFRELAFADTTCTIGEEYEANIQWESEQLHQKEIPENSCAVLVGPSGIGKSAWAKRVAPKPALWVSHMDVLRMYRPNYHRSIIFDDMCFTHMPLQAQIHIVDWIDSRQIHCRYGYATIPAKTVKIFTCNEHPFTDHPAINRRITLFSL